MYVWMYCWINYVCIGLFPANKLTTWEPLMLLCSSETSSGNNHCWILAALMRHVKWLCFCTATWPSITSEECFSSHALLDLTETSLCPSHRHSEHSRLQHLWEVLKEGEIRIQSLIINGTAAGCMCKLTLFLMMWRTTNGCWIWWGISFWLQTWLTTFAFSRTCRRWLMVSPIGSVSTAPSHV